MVPKRADELIDGGSLFWVIRGQIMCRERILDIRPFIDKDGIGRCRVVLEPQGACWSSRGRSRAFQGWRYLEAKDAPRDLVARRARRRQDAGADAARTARTRTALSARLTFL